MSPSLGNLAFLFFETVFLQPQLADKVYFKNGSCYFAQIKFYKKDSATEQRAPSGRELSSEARLKEPAGDYATIFDKDVAFDARGLLPPPTVVPLPPGGRPYYHRLCTFCQIQLKDTTLSSAWTPACKSGSFLRFLGDGVM